MRSEQITTRMISGKLAEYRHQPIPSRPEGFHQAAVLVPVTELGGEPVLILTRRSMKVKTHQGQVAFPGGMQDPGDSGPEAAALRELEEETGIQPGSVRIIGRLSDRLTISDFCVTPFVGYIKTLPEGLFSVENEEIARIFYVPLNWLASPVNVRIENWEHQKFIHKMHFWKYDREVIWGMTGDVIRELIESVAGNRFQDVPVSESSREAFLASLNR
ncbi:MAG: CoA pyrophosphatase [Bacteroidetes bacterium]|nr:CoA pyrophosphatase [Bacteroidota bacterium]